MASIFTKIVNGEIPSYKVAESDNFYAFLDISPITLGHTLVIPKEEIDYLFDIDDAHYQQLTLFAKKVAEGLKEAIPCKRIGVAVLGMEVPHAHIHLIPLNSEKELSFSRPKLKLSKEEMSQTAKKIAEKIKL